MCMAWMAWMDVVVCLDIRASASSFPGRVGKIILPDVVSFSERTEDKMHGACFQCNLSLSVLHCGMFMFFFCFRCCHSETLFLDSFATKNVCNVWHVETSLKCLLLAIELSFHNKVTLIHPLIRLRKKNHHIIFFLSPKCDSGFNWSVTFQKKWIYSFIEVSIDRLLLLPKYWSTERIFLLPKHQFAGFWFFMTTF